jgi:hypothetical protein
MADYVEEAIPINDEDYDGIKWILSRILPETPYMFITISEEEEGQEVRVLTNMPMASQLEIANYIKDRLKRYQ